MSNHRGASAKQNEMRDIQHLDLVEKNVKPDRMLLLVLAGLIVLTLIVTVSISLVSSLYASDAKQALAAEISELQEKIKELRSDLQITQLQLQFTSNEIPEVKALFENSDTPAIQKLILEQEEDLQELIRSLKAGMYDLARIVPGSRTWLELYSAKMELTLRSSLDRQKVLQGLIADSERARPETGNSL